MPTDVYPALSETSNKGILEPPFVDNDYKNMEAALYAYAFGAISFLELLAIFERVLNVMPESSETEMVSKGLSADWLSALLRVNVKRTGVQYCKQNDWAFLSQARVSPATSKLQRNPLQEP